MSISAQASAEKASGVVRCLRGERVRHEEDNTTQPETETGAGNVRRSLGVSALRDEIPPEKARSKPGNAGTDIWT